MDIVTRTILNYNHKCTGTILSRLCKRSHHATTFNRAWTLNKHRSFPERYKIFSSCRRHESHTINEMNAYRKSEEHRKYEAKQIRSVLENSMYYKDTLFPSLKVVAYVSFEEINKLRSTDWSSKSADESLNALKLLTFFYLNGASYEPLLFNSICEVCLAKLPEFDDSQIQVLLQYLISLKSTMSSLTLQSSFVKGLNKECLKRFYSAKKPVKILLLITDAFHQLNDKSDSDYIWRVMRRLCQKPHRLGEKEFVQALYYLNLHKLINCVNMFEIECCLKDCIEELSGNELGIIARGFFINKKSIVNAEVLSAIIEKATNSIQSMDSLFIEYVMRLISYRSSFIRIIMFLTMKNIYVPELLQFVYSRDYLQRTYNCHKCATRELLILHCSVKIELPQHEGPLLTPNWHKLFPKNDGSKNNKIINKVMSIKTEIVHICKNKLRINVFTDYILPYYTMWDIIFAMDEQNNSIDVEYILSAMPQGPIKSVNNEESKAIKWHAIIFVPPSYLVNNGCYTGIMQQKFRQLSILGYTPIPIIENEWVQLAEGEKEGFLRKLIYRDVRCNVATN